MPLPARYLCRLLDEAERILDMREEEAGGPVQQARLLSRSHRSLEPWGHERRPHEHAIAS